MVSLCFLCVFRACLACCRYQKKSWKTFITDKNRHLISDEAMDLLDKMLQYDHYKRPTAKECMSHAYFAPVVKAAANAPKPSLSQNSNSVEMKDVSGGQDRKD